MPAEDLSPEFVKALNDQWDESPAWTRACPDLIHEIENSEVCFTAFTDQRTFFASLRIPGSPDTVKFQCFGVFSDFDDAMQVAYMLSEFDWWPIIERNSMEKATDQDRRAIRGAVEIMKSFNSFIDNPAQYLDSQRKIRERLNL